MRRDDARAGCSAAAAGRYLKRSVRPGSDRMNHHAQFFIDGRWIDPAKRQRLSTSSIRRQNSHLPTISLGSNADVDRAVRRRKARLRQLTHRPRRARIDLACSAAFSTAIIAGRGLRLQAVSREMGAPLSFARDAQVWAGRVHLEATIEALQVLRIQPTARNEPHRQGADRGRGADHPLELAAEPDRLQGGAGASGRLHSRVEAERNRPDQRDRVRRNRRSGRNPSWRVQSRQRNRS